MKFTKLQIALLVLGWIVCISYFVSDTLLTGYTGLSMHQVISIRNIIGCIVVVAFFAAVVFQKWERLKRPE